MTAMPTTRILLTGFGPFPGVAQNASQEYAPQLAKQARDRFQTAHVTIMDEILPTEWQTAPTKVSLIFAKFAPHLVLHFGVARDIRGFDIEELAQNECACSEDACGETPRDAQIAQGHPNRLYATIPTRQIVKALQALGYPAQCSRDAGTYICNKVFYESLASSEQCKPCPAVGFIHLPEDLGATTCALSWDKALHGGVKIIELCLILDKKFAETSSGPNYALSKNG